MDDPGRAQKKKQLPPLAKPILGDRPRAHAVLMGLGSLFGLALMTEGLVAIARAGPRPGVVVYTVFFAFVAVVNGFGVRRSVRAWRDPEGESAKREARHEAMLQLPRKVKLRRAGLLVGGFFLVLLTIGLLVVLGAHSVGARVMGWVLVAGAAAFGLAGAYRLRNPVYDLDPPGEPLEDD